MARADLLSVGSAQDDLGAAAAVAAGWSGLVLPHLTLSGFSVLPVVDLDEQVVGQRLRDGQPPQTDASTLAVWEGWDADLGPMPPRSPLSIVGFISTASPRRAIYALDVLAGYGAGLVVFDGVRGPAAWTVRECEMAGLAVVWHHDGESTCVMPGRPGPIATARRTVATRQKEELVFAHALRAGVLGLAVDGLRGGAYPRA
ncbi:hypothetical protein H7J87_22835 [Mycolicibacterium wolinskyi]|uniref:Uncharacterized protein n=1 Tax=Mycolicibacterium wolinskyi TaxID=59750 RepID=A0A1X2FIY8_9MYCO|nr:MULTISPECIES: hypothetical protein [Mycolicibacterium]MCV7288162.1 hypothetical protein [Mycolicibacterium wolinskyi]MCV7296887.1 hypothetical protein [Mycolicibacterium goodii]ORX18403.1 hypothetical protein AWC31_13925 [Mycolicibacterium wolinskyi]